MRIDILTIFPGMFEGPMSASMVGLARERGLVELELHDLRSWTTDRHRTTDDCPYGGGPGMVMKPEPIFAAVRSIAAQDEPEPFVVFLSPSGRVFDQDMAEELSSRERLLLVCGRYEGLDERTFALADLTLSVGDYVLTGGELPAMVVVDAVTRLIPGVLGDDSSATDESFAGGLLEYPQYTRPQTFEGVEVPDVLLSGDHARVASWRREQAILRTARLRPDLIEKAELTPEERMRARTATEGRQDA